MINEKANNSHVPKITNNEWHLQRTIKAMTGEPISKAFSLPVLFDAMTQLPFTSEIIFDKIFGRWIFTNQHEDEWSKVMSGHITNGPNFTFVSNASPEQAIIRGIHYYYHTKICENETD